MLVSEKPYRTAEISSQPETRDPIIQLQNVVKTYTTGAHPFTALKNITTSFHEGEYTGIIGKSGAGKTTLVNMISGVDQITSGEVLVNNLSIHELNESRMALWRGKNMGVVFQFFQLLPMLNLVDNIMLPMDFCHRYHPKKSFERAMHLLEQVELEDHAFKLPSAISGGQQQRVAIARALANNPPIIVADEPTGSLDSSTAETIYKIFNDLVSQGKTIIIVSHDPTLSSRVDRTILIADGEIIDEQIARLFPLLSHQQMLIACHQLKNRVYSPEEMICVQDQPVDNLFMIVEGEATLSVQTLHKDQKIYQTLKAGDIYGDIELVNGGNARFSLSPSNEIPVHVKTIDRQSFNQLLVASKPSKDYFSQMVQEKLARISSWEKDNNN